MCRLHPLTKVRSGEIHWLQSYRRRVPTEAFNCCVSSSRIDCNLQRLDGPVRGNGQIIQGTGVFVCRRRRECHQSAEGSNWDHLFVRDTEGRLARRLGAPVDGQYQTLSAQDGAYNLQQFFGSDPELQRLIADWSPAHIETLNRGGHDLKKICATFAPAKSHGGAPTVILAKTTKGYGHGRAGRRRRGVAFNFIVYPLQYLDLALWWTLLAQALPQFRSPYFSTTRFRQFLTVINFTRVFIWRR
jgi:hypothetical protein